MRILQKARRPVEAPFSQEMAAPHGLRD